MYGFILMAALGGGSATPSWGGPFYGCCGAPVAGGCFGSACYGGVPVSFGCWSSVPAGGCYGALAAGYGCQGSLWMTCGYACTGCSGIAFSPGCYGGQPAVYRPYYGTLEGAPAAPEGEGVVIRLPADLRHADVSVPAPATARGLRVHPPGRTGPRRADDDHRQACHHPRRGGTEGHADLPTDRRRWAQTGNFSTFPFVDPCTGWIDHVCQAVPETQEVVDTVMRCLPEHWTENFTVAIQSCRPQMWTVTVRVPTTVEVVRTERVPVTTCREEVQTCTERVPVQREVVETYTVPVCTMRPETETYTVRVQECRPEVRIRRVPVTTYRTVAEVVTETIPTTTCTWVPCQVRTWLPACGGLE
jgi:hypothetical protein